MTKRPQRNSELIRQVLGKDYLELKVKKLTLEEDFDSAESIVRIQTLDTHGSQIEISGSGCGLGDAVFAGFLERYALEYQSLKTLQLVGFSVNAHLDTKKGHSGVDAMGEVVLQVRNSEGDLFDFSDESRSVASSTARVVIAVVEYFVNAERAFITLYKSLQDAKTRNRADLVTRFTTELSEVVKSTSYAEVIENIKEASGVFHIAKS